VDGAPDVRLESFASATGSQPPLPRSDRPRRRTALEEGNPSMEPWIAVAVVAALVLISRALLFGARGAGPEVVRRKLATGATVVDVRTRGEFRGGAYPGALNVPLEELSTRLAEIPKDRPVVLYCASGARSGIAAGRLRKAGYEDVVNAGGLGAMPG
jgi:phage shock protein E